ncbi:MAG: amidase [Alphaproteobacteria bacterium]
MTDLALASAVELLTLYRKKKASPVEATKAALARIEKLNPVYNAFRLVDEKSALADAKRAEKRWHGGKPLGPLDGVPVTVKDILLTRGWSTLRGSKAIDPNQKWNDDAPGVARMRESGAVLLGKTTTPELGWKGVTDSPLTGITRNPWNKKKTPGGSSGGAAVAAALGMGALHFGTDGGGSIRIPAALTGIFGLKATFGRVPAFPASPFGTLANVGPMTRSVADAALMLNVIAQPDWRDWFALPPTAEDYLKDIDKGGAKGLRIAFSRNLGGHKVMPEVKRLVDQAVKALGALGADMIEDEPQLGNVAETFQVHWYAPAHALVNSFSPEAQAQIDPGLREIARIGGTYSIDRWLTADAHRREIGQAMNRFFQRYDFFITPQLPLTAFDVGLNRPGGSGGDSDKDSWVDWTPFTYPFNLSRHPAASVPCGVARDGLPVAFQLVGPFHSERRMLQVCRAYERAHPFALPQAAQG